MSRFKSIHVQMVAFMAGIALVGVAGHAIACGCSGLIAYGNSQYCDSRYNGWVGYDNLSDQTEYGILADSSVSTSGSAYDSNGSSLGCDVGPYNDGQTHSQSCNHQTIEFYSCCVRIAC